MCTMRSMGSFQSKQDGSEFLKCLIIKTDNISTFIHPTSLTLLGLNLPIRCQINPHSPFPCEPVPPWYTCWKHKFPKGCPASQSSPFIKTATPILTCTVYTYPVIDFRIELELSHRHGLKIQALTGIYDCWEQVEVKHQAEMWGRPAL